MVFNKCYDRSLLLMLLADKKNNVMIMNFLKFMPEEMHDYICKFISMNSHLTNSSCLKTLDFNSWTMLKNDGFLYRISGGLECGLLTIKLNRCNYEVEIDEKIELTLYPLRIYELDKNLSIGSFSYQLESSNSFKNKNSNMFFSKKYFIKKIPFNNLLISSSDVNLCGKIVSINSCFGKELKLDSLINDNETNKFSKKKGLVNRKVGYR